MGLAVSQLKLRPGQPKLYLSSPGIDDFSTSKPLPGLKIGTRVSPKQHTLSDFLDVSLPQVVSMAHS